MNTISNIVKKVLSEHVPLVLKGLIRGLILLSRTVRSYRPLVLFSYVLLKCHYYWFVHYIGCESIPAPGSMFCKVHQEDETPAILPSHLSRETLSKLNKEQKKRSAELERDSIFVIEKIMGKKCIDGKSMYLIKWENYEEKTWEKADNIPLIFRNYYEKTGNQNIPEPRIKHSKKVGSTTYHLLSWDSDNVYWEKEDAFSLEGFESSSHSSDFSCQTQKVKNLLL